MLTHFTTLKLVKLVYSGNKNTFDLLCIKNTPVVDVSAQTGFIRVNYWYPTAGKFVWLNFSDCTIAFVVSKMKLLKLT